MKNRCSFYFTLLALILFSCSHFSAAAFDYKVPPKPRDYVADDANIFDQTALWHLKIHCSQKVLNRVVIQPYVLTIKDTLWSHIDSVILMVCNAWNIYDTDSFALLIMSDAKAPRFRTVTSVEGRRLLTDTLATFLCSQKLPELSRTKGAAAAANLFVNSICLSIYDGKLNFSDDYTNPIYYTENDSVDKITERVSLQTEYDIYRSSGGKARLVTGISTTLVEIYIYVFGFVAFVYLILWSRYNEYS